jgi:hypothetical protein
MYGYMHEIRHRPASVEAVLKAGWNGAEMALERRCRGVSR